MESMILRRTFTSSFRGRRSEAQANLESSNQQRRLLDRPVEPGDDSEVWLHLNEKRSDRR
jgi:hypothetical protein